MSKIRILDEETINQIAAGEVIENPASVVKELVENAIDAKASEIIVEITGGGRQLIRISDNGLGMSNDDALLCLERYATSKIRKSQDLWQLNSMGFRGEALSSIAAISHFSLLTSPRKEEIIKELQQGTQAGTQAGTQEGIQAGTQISATGGKISTCCSTKCFPGTTIEVRSLFYNVPARRKFQKSPEKDAFEITKLLSQLALAHPEVAFELIMNGKKELVVPASSFVALFDRLQAVLGKEFAKDLVPISFSDANFQIRGFLSKPEQSRPNRTGQHLFINRRLVHSLACSYAIKEGYGTAIDAIRHPSFVLYLDMLPQEVDVNVHPQKKEVRFSREDLVRQALTHSVSNTLFSQHKTQVPMPAPSFTPQNTFFRTELSTPLPLPFAVTKKEETQELLNLETMPFRFVGIFEPYFLLEGKLPDPFREEGLIFIDAKRALSRILYEDLIKVESLNVAQTLLVPHFIELNAADATFLQMLIPDFLRIGIQIREFGASSFLVESLPSVLDAIDIEEFIHECIRKKSEWQSESDPLHAQRKLAQIASRTRAKKIFPVNDSYALQLMKRLYSCQDPTKCPYGEPIAVVITKEEVAKKFQ